MNNNYAKVVRYGRITDFFFFDDRQPDQVSKAVVEARTTAMSKDGRVSVFRWKPGMASWLGSVMPCDGLQHDWRPNPFDADAKEHPGWTCGRCARVCSEEDAQYDLVVGRVPEHITWSKHCAST